MPQNIVEAYRQAVYRKQNARDIKPDVFDAVIEFCENNDRCRVENSIKRNTLLFWAYDKSAEVWWQRKDFFRAVDLWQKAMVLTQKTSEKIKIGHKVLAATETADAAMSEKAKIIVKTASVLEKEYLKAGDERSAKRMHGLQLKAEQLLRFSKMKH